MLVECVRFRASGPLQKTFGPLLLQAWIAGIFSCSTLWNFHATNLMERPHNLKGFWGTLYSLTKTLRWFDCYLCRPLSSLWEIARRREQGLTIRVRATRMPMLMLMNTKMKMNIHNHNKYYSDDDNRQASKAKKAMMWARARS